MTPTHSTATHTKRAADLAASSGRNARGRFAKDNPGKPAGARDRRPRAPRFWRELTAKMGAGVVRFHVASRRYVLFNPATQAPLVAARIPCVVLNSFAPERPGTTILAGVRPAPVGPGDSPVRSISCKRGITVLNVRSPADRGSTGFLADLFAVFERHGIAVDVIATSEVNVSVSVEQVRGLDALRQDLEALGEVSVFPRRAIVAVVGIGLRGVKGLAGRIFTAVQSVNVEVISQGASEINVTFVVREEDAAEAVRRLHAALISGEKGEGEAA